MLKTLTASALHTMQWKHLGIENVFIIRKAVTEERSW